jgi:hypothetical protein
MERICSTQGEVSNVGLYCVLQLECIGLHIVTYTAVATHRPRSTPQKHYFSASRTLIHLIGSRNRDLPPCSIVS